MIITKEQQEALVDNYARTHNVDETIGFIDGIIALIKLIENL